MWCAAHSARVQLKKHIVFENMQYPTSLMWINTESTDATKSVQVEKVVFSGS